MERKEKGKLSCFLTGLAGCTGECIHSEWDVLKQPLRGYMPGGYLRIDLLALVRWWALLGGI